MRRPVAGPNGSAPSGRFGSATLYRAAAADLALARRAFPGDPVVARLEELVSRARAASSTTRRPAAARCIRFFARDYWRLVAARSRSRCSLAFVLLFGPAALAGGWALAEPGRCGRARAGASSGRATQSERHLARPDARRAGASSRARVFTNNIQVTLVAFAGGMTLGVLDRRDPDLQRRPARRGRRADGRRRQLARLRRARHRRTACSSSRASSSPARPGCGSAGRSSRRATARGPSRRGSRRGGGRDRARHRAVAGRGRDRRGEPRPARRGRARRATSPSGFAIGGALLVLSCGAAGAVTGEPEPSPAGTA